MMPEIPEQCERLLHSISTVGADGNRRSALEAEIRISLVREQIESADKIAKASADAAKSLKTATWVLSGATIVLAIATVILVIVTANANP
jgi:cell division protein FtsX